MDTLCDCPLYSMHFEHFKRKTQFLRNNLYVIHYCCKDHLRREFIIEKKEESDQGNNQEKKKNVFISPVGLPNLRGGSFPP